MIPIEIITMLIMGMCSFKILNVNFHIKKHFKRDLYDVILERK